VLSWDVYTSVIVQNIFMGIDGSTALHSQENITTGICKVMLEENGWLILPTLSVKSRVTF
jgi:hypothetical protein